MRSPLYEATRGNPLALLELPGLLSAEQLAGTARLSDPLPAGSTVERAFARRAEALPDNSQRALVVAAVSSSSEAEVIVAGLAGLGLPADSLEPAEDAALVRIIEGRLEFRHPLVRSAVYHGAPASDRRSAHRALAEALGGSSHPEARAWHLAQARRSVRTARRPTRWRRPPSTHDGEARHPLACRADPALRERTGTQLGMTAAISQRRCRLKRPTPWQSSP